MTGWCWAGLSAAFCGGVVVAAILWAWSNGDLP